MFFDKLDPRMIDQLRKIWLSEVTDLSPALTASWSLFQSSLEFNITLGPFLRCTSLLFDCQVVFLTMLLSVWIILVSNVWCLAPFAPFFLLLSRVIKGQRFWLADKPRKSLAERFAPFNHFKCCFRHNIAQGCYRQWRFSRYFKSKLSIFSRSKTAAGTTSDIVKGKQQRFSQGRR